MKHKWLKQSLKQQGSFLHRLALLLKEGYTFHDAVRLLLPHHTSQYEQKQIAVEHALKEGYGPSIILRKIGFSESELLPIAIAEINGQLISSLQQLAERVKNKEERQKRLTQLLLYPFLLFAFFTFLMMGFRQFFLPNFQLLMNTRFHDGTSWIQFLPAIVSKLPDYILLFILFLSVFLILLSILQKKLNIERKIRFIRSFPFVGKLIRMQKTRDFSGELGSLLQSGLSLQEALQTLSEQTLDPVLSYLSTRIQSRVIYGDPFYQAASFTQFFLKDLSVFIQHGSNNGHLPKELLIYSEQVNEQIDQKFTKILALLQPMLFCILAICIVLAYLAILLPIYQLIDQF